MCGVGCRGEGRDAEVTRHTLTLCVCVAESSLSSLQLLPSLLLLLSPPKGEAAKAEGRVAMVAMGKLVPGSGKSLSCGRESRGDTDSTAEERRKER